jgi:predicted outer membrane repeat protein
MTNNRFFNHCLICALILVTGLGLAFVLPLLASSQGFAARSEVGTQDYAPEASTRYYVATTGDGSEPTVGWSTAYTNVQDALGAASGGDEIWVAAGVYYPDQGVGQINDAVTSTFFMTDGVALYGGFDISDAVLTDRDWENNVTVLSGDIDWDNGGADVTDPNGVVITTTNIISDNAYHVVTGSGVTKTAVLDGFTITAGRAHGKYSLPCGTVCGGGMYNNDGSPALTNVVFSGNSADYYGGGMYNEQGIPTLINVTFSGNSSDKYGGGIYNNESSPALTNVVFSSNSAGKLGGGLYKEYGNLALTNVVFSGNSARDGGGMYNLEPSSALTNVVFSGNSAEVGGGLFNEESSPTLTNVTFSGNSSDEEGGGIYNYYSSPDVRNSILWNNRANGVTGTISATIFNYQSTITLTHSLVEGSNGSGPDWDCEDCTDGEGNLDENPLFVLDVNPSDAPTTTGDLRLQVGSPAIDAGNNLFIAGFASDLDGEARIKDGDGDDLIIVDMGAYEYQPKHQLSVSKTGTGDGTVTSTPEGIECGETCTASFTHGTSVTLSAVPVAGSVFSGWGGDCSDGDDCVLTIDAAKNVTATFDLGLSNYLPLVKR